MDSVENCTLDSADEPSCADVQPNSPTAATSIIADAQAAILFIIFMVKTNLSHLHHMEEIVPCRHATAKANAMHSNHGRLKLIHIENGPALSSACPVVLSFMV